MVALLLPSITFMWRICDRIGSHRFKASETIDFTHIPEYRSASTHNGQRRDSVFVTVPA